MSIVRKNTLVIDLSVLPARPDAGQVHQFLENEIKLQLSDVRSIQLHNSRKCVYIEMVDHDTAVRYQKAHNIRRIFVFNNKRFKIPVYVDSEAVTVRIHDLPSSVLHATVAAFMTRFGEVISIQNERWRQFFPGIPNGVRLLQMRLKGSIPSYITIENEICFVEHKNQLKTCKWCSRAVHPKQKCQEIAAAEKANTTTEHETAQASKSTNPSAQTEKIFSDSDFPPMSSKPCSSNKHITETRNNEASDKTQAESRSVSVPTETIQSRDDESYDDDDDDDDGGSGGGGSSSSPYEADDTTTKRRMLTRSMKEYKKRCINQGSQNDCES